MRRHGLPLRTFFAFLMVLAVACLGCGGGGNTPPPPPSNPSPGISNLSPASVIAGAAAQTLTINGSNFLSSSSVTFNGSARQATFVSATQLTIALTSSDLARGGSFPVVVTNPAPGGGFATSSLVVKAVLSIQLAPANASILVGASQQFSATAMLDDGSAPDVTALVAWNTSASSVATTNASGRASSVAIGRTRISASLGSVNGSTTLIVVGNATAGVGRFAYVANNSDNTISIYTVNASTGQLRQTGYVSAGAGPSVILVEPRGKFSYVVNSNDNTVSGFAIDAAGALAPVPGSPFTAGSFPVSLIADPSGSFLYVANSGSGDVSAFAIDAASGKLTAIGSPVTAGANPSSIAADPLGRFVYVANPTSNSVSAYKIDAATGALTAVAGAPFTAGTSPSAVTVDPSGRFVYVANGVSRDVSAFAINSATGALTAIPGSPFPTGDGMEIAGLTVAPSGKFLYVANFGSSSVSAFSVNADGTLAPLTGSPFAVGNSPRNIVIDPTGAFAYVSTLFSDQIEVFSIDASGALTIASRVRTRPQASAIALSVGSSPVTYTPKFAYVANHASNDVSAFTIDPATGALTSVGANVAADAGPFGVAADPAGKFVYVTNLNANTVSGYTINPTTGELSPIGAAVATGNNPAGLVVDPSGRFLYVTAYLANEIWGYRIDRTTGALTPLASSHFPAGVEPASAAVDPTGRFLFVTNQGGMTGGACVPGFVCGVSAYSIDRTTGALTPVPGPFLAGPEPSGVAVHPSGRFVYVANEYADTTYQFSIDALTGALTQIGATLPQSGHAAKGIAIEPSGRFLYQSDNLSYLVDQALGTLTLFGTSFGEGFSISAEASGKYVYMADPGGVLYGFAIDPVTGLLTTVPGLPLLPTNQPMGITTVSTIY